MIVMTKKGNRIKGKSDERENGLRGSQEGGKGSQRGKSRLVATQQIVWLFNILILIILNILNILIILIILIILNILNNILIILTILIILILLLFIIIKITL